MSLKNENIPGILFLKNRIFLASEREDGTFLVFF